MAVFTFQQALTFVGTLVIDEVEDQAMLAAGQPVSLPRVQVGTVGGKALYLEGTLTTSP